MGDLFVSRAEALRHYSRDYELIRYSDVVRCVDVDGWAHSDETSTCVGCGEHFFHESSLEDRTCDDCAAEAAADRVANRQNRSAYLQSVL